MSLQRLSYVTIKDVQGRYDGAAAPPTDTSPSSVGAKAKKAVAVAVALTTVAVFCGLGIRKVFDARSNATEAAGVTPAGWQDRQPLAGSTLTAFSEDLKSPENRWSKDGELRTTLRVAPIVVQAGPLAPPLNVRAYEGSVPGPTLRVKLGDRLVVNLLNDLGLPNGDPVVAEGGEGAGGGADGGSDSRAALEGKVEAWPNVTNIHVHGLHVSPSGIGDNIYRRAGPGDALEYVYDLPADHYPGTFYYHPHFEGSSSVQTLGGMSGAIVVEDPEGSLPSEVEKMREVVMVLQETNIESGALRNYKAASKIAGSNMPLHGDIQWGDKEADRTGEGKDDMLHFVTVNGQYQPIVQAQPGEALRLRIVHGGNNDHIRLSLEPAAAAAATEAAAQSIGTTEEEPPGEGTGTGRRGGSISTGSGGCTLLTLARDGVYLRPAPRRYEWVVLAPGSRADLAVRCDRAGVYRLASSKRDEEEDGDRSFMAYIGKSTDVFEGTLAFVKVEGDVMDMALPTESPAAVNTNRLLEDLRDLPDDQVSRFVFEFNSAEKVFRLGQAYTWYGINGVQYSNSSQVMRRVPLGSVEEWVIVNQRKGRGCHPPPLPPPSRPASPGWKEPVDPGRKDNWNREGGSGGGAAEDREDDGGGYRHGRTRSRTRRLGVLSERPAERKEGGERAPVACGTGGPEKIIDDGHPFHLHVNHFQVVSSTWGDEGPDWKVGDWRDTISIPTPGNVTIRWKADDFIGEAVAHCHIFGHSDTGMMMNFEIFDST